MDTELAISGFKKYNSPKGEFYLSQDLVTEYGTLKNDIKLRVNVDNILRELEKQHDLPEGSIQIPNFYQSFAAAEQDKALKKSIFSIPTEWQSILILSANTPAEIGNYVLMDAKENVLKKSEKLRSLNPKKTYDDGDKRIFVSNVSDIDFESKPSRFNPEDLDPETGFLEKTDPEGKYLIWFGGHSMLYATCLDSSGGILCFNYWGELPFEKGLRGSYTGKLPKNLLCD
jgi:hypothetical protein